MQTQYKFFAGGEYMIINPDIQLPEQTVQEQLEKLLPSMTEQELLRVLAYAQGTGATRMALSESNNNNST